MTGDIRYVSPITQTVCKEYSVLRQGKQLPVRLCVSVCINVWCLSCGLRFLVVGLISSTEVCLFFPLADVDGGMLIMKFMLIFAL